MRRRDFLKSMAAASGAALATSAGAAAHRGVRADHRVLVIAFDGIDPRILKGLIDSGRCPHLAQLAATGSFSRIATSTPPHTPVAFSNIISGADAGVHQVYDFIHRDPNPPGGAAVRPYFSTAEATAPEHQWSIPLGQWELPLTGGSTELLRRGPSFWDYLVRAGVDTSVFYLPSNYPPSDPDGPGRFQCTSGMGTPDLLGSYGEFTFLSPDAPRGGRTVDGGRFVHLRVRDHEARAQLTGPPDFLRKPEEAVPLETEVRIVRDPKSKVAKIELCGNLLLLNEGEWSQWIPIEFRSPIPGSTTLGALGAPTAIQGIARLFLKQVHPKLELYISPVNIDPLSPISPISSPADLSPQLAKQHGRFYTTGIPEDTKALTNGVLSEDQFLEQSELVVDERIRQFRGALEQFERGCLFFYFGATDLVQHMFWRDRDPQHPGRVPEEADRYEKVVEDTYLRIDRQVADAMEALGPDDTLMVMSDHGFTSFRRGFNLNSWLCEQGFLKLKNPSQQGQSMLFANTDWGGTQAYGMGLNGLYINTKGREKFGSVAESAQRSTLEQIRDQLLEARDADGTPIVMQADLVADLFPGADPRIAPDLIVGYADGYRASWATVLGQMPRAILEDNLDRWSGTHLTAPGIVPGVLVTNRKVQSEVPSISDIAPTILSEFGIDTPATMTGRPMFT